MATGRYTYAGDANLDGLIDGRDYFFIDSSITLPGASGYGNGDFNYDGVVDGTDYFYIDLNISLQGSPLGDSSPLDIAAVPEPVVSLVSGLIGTISMLRRRRAAEVKL